MPGADQDTPVLIKLGKELYFEKRLSVNHSISCNTCHPVDHYRAGADNDPTSDGAHGQRGQRNSPTVFNAGFHAAQFWDGRAKDLVEQAKAPILNPVEMAMPSEAEVGKRLGAIKRYQQLFVSAFPGTPEKITYEMVARALAAFERTLVTHDRFDDFLEGKDRALSRAELEGLNLFLTLGCTACHQGALLGGTTFQKVGLVHPYPNTDDLGRFVVTKDESDRFKFKVPSLRNVALTPPYFHDGKVATLQQAVRQMAYMQLDRQITDAQVRSLVAFLKSLSDARFRAL
jgi:cytochrome c peroxidase